MFNTTDFSFAVSVAALTGGTAGLLINPASVAISPPANLVISSSSVSSVSSPATFWDRFSTYPHVQLNGLEGAAYFKIILTLFFLYVGIYLYSEGRDITDTIARVFRVDKGTAIVIDI